MGTISSIINGYVAFATEDGTIHDNGTVVLLGGAVLIVALAVYAAYNVAAAVAAAARRTVVGTVRGVVGIGHMIGHKPEVAVPVAVIPVQRSVPAAQVGTGRPIVRRTVAKVG